jgi:hypothetical protein
MMAFSVGIHDSELNVIFHNRLEWVKWVLDHDGDSYHEEIIS